MGKANKALVLGAHRNGVQQRSGRHSDWTRKMGEQFCETLADTCNVTLAAGAIGRSIGNVYKWRAKDATFRAAWKIGIDSRHVNTKKGRPITRRLRKMRGTSTGKPVRSRAPWR